MDSDEAEPILRAMERAIRDMARVTPLVGAQYAYEAIRSFMPRQGETPAPQPPACKHPRSQGWMDTAGNGETKCMDCGAVVYSVTGRTIVPQLMQNAEQVKTPAEGSL
jgi:hypothetical protein